MQSNSSDSPTFAHSLLINFVAPIALVAVAVLIFISLGTVEPPKRPEEDQSRAGRLRALPPIRVEPITALDAEKTPLFLSVDGTVVPFEEANVAAEVSGRIISKEEQCEAGSPVKKGDLLMTIDPEDYKLEVQRLAELRDQEYQRLQEVDQQMVNSRRLIEVAELDLEIQQKEIERLESLPEGFASQTEIDQANRAMLAAKQQLVSLENQRDLQKKQRVRIEASERLAATQLQVAEVNLRRTAVRAPIDGIIVSEQVDVNTFVSRGNPLLTIENTSKVQVSTSLRMDQLYWILDQGETAATLETSSYDLPQTDAIIEYEVAGRHGMIRQWRGTLKSYDGIGLDPKTRTVPVRVVVDKPSEFLQDSESSIAASTTTPLVRGMFVRIHLLIRPRTKLFVIPTKALQPGNRIYEFTVDESILDSSDNTTEPESLQPTPKVEPKNKRTFDASKWVAGRVRIREAVIPVNSLAIGDSRLRRVLDPSDSSNDNTSMSESIEETGDFWVCELAGLKGEMGRYVVTSPLGTISETIFSARAEKQVAGTELEEGKEQTKSSPKPVSPEKHRQQTESVGVSMDAHVKKGAQA